MHEFPADLSKYLLIKYSENLALSREQAVFIDTCCSRLDFMDCEMHFLNQIKIQIKSHNQCQTQRDRAVYHQNGHNHRRYNHQTRSTLAKLHNSIQQLHNGKHAVW